MAWMIGTVECSAQNIMGKPTDKAECKVCGERKSFWPTDEDPGTLKRLEAWAKEHSAKHETAFMNMNIGTYHIGLNGKAIGLWSGTWGLVGMILTIVMATVNRPSHTAGGTNIKYFWPYVVAWLGPFVLFGTLLGIVALVCYALEYGAPIRIERNERYRAKIRRLTAERDAARQRVQDYEKGRI